jgi:hypothetical protein
MEQLKNLKFIHLQFNTKLPQQSFKIYLFYFLPE